MIKSHIKATTACAVVAAFSLANSTALARGAWPDAYEVERYGDYFGEEGGSGYADWDRGREPAPYYGEAEDDYFEERGTPYYPYGRAAPRWEDEEAEFARDRVERRYRVQPNREPLTPLPRVDEPVEPAAAELIAPPPQPNEAAGAQPALPVAEAAEPAPADLAAAVPPAEAGASSALSESVDAAVEPPEAELVAVAPAPDPGLSDGAAIDAAGEVEAAELAKPNAELPALSLASRPEIEKPATLAEITAAPKVRPGAVVKQLVESVEAPSAKVVEVIPPDPGPAPIVAKPSASEELPALIDVTPESAANAIAAARSVAKNGPLSTCDSAVKGERFTVSKINSAASVGEGWEVKGLTSDGLNFTCQIDDKGKVALLDIDDLAAN